MYCNIVKAVALFGLLKNEYKKSTNQICRILYRHVVSIRHKSQYQLTNDPSVHRLRLTYQPGDSIWEWALPTSGAVLDVACRGKRENRKCTEKRDHPCCHCPVLDLGLTLTRLFLLLASPSCLCSQNLPYLYQMPITVAIGYAPSHGVTLSSWSGPSVPTMDESTHSKDGHFQRKTERTQSRHSKLFIQLLLFFFS